MMITDVKAMKNKISKANDLTIGINEILEQLASDVDQDEIVVDLGVVLRAVCELETSAMRFISLALDDAERIISIMERNSKENEHQNS